MSTLTEQLGALSSSSSSSSSGAVAVTLLYSNVHGSLAKSIPLSTTRENAMVAYESLVLSLSTSSSSTQCTTSSAALADELLSAHNLTTFERGIANHELNIQMDVRLDAFLSWLALHLAACDAYTATSSTTSASNNNGAIVIIEYLLRLYELHTRPSTACALLTALLPLLATTAASSTTSLSTSSQFFTQAATIIEVAGIGLDNVTLAGCWSFLRPYIVVTTNGARGGGGGGGGGMMMINQKILAIQCAKNDAFAYQIISNKLSIIAAEYSTTLHNTSTNVGASAILSFTASILVESLYLQMSSPYNGGSEGRGGGKGGVRESSVRALLPTILDACRHHSCQVGEEGTFSNSNINNNSINEEQWKSWGYILLSTIVTTCPSLGHTVKIAMCDAIVDGLVAVKTKRVSSKTPTTSAATKSITFHEASLTTFDNENENDDACCGAILTLITVLGTMNTTTTTTTTTDDNDEDEWRYYLPLLPPKMRKKSTIIDYLGCELPISTYKRLSKLQYGYVASAISLAMHVVTTEEEDDDAANVVMITMEKIAPLVATLIMNALYKLDCESRKMLTTTSTTVTSMNDDDDYYNIKCKADRDVLLILGLIRQPSLLSLWKANRASLIAATTVHTISSYDRLLLHNNDDQSIVSSSRMSSSSSSTTTATIMTAIVERYKSIIDALSIVDRDAHERGVSYVVNTVTIEATDTSNEYRMSNLVRLLGGHDVSTATSTITTATKGKKKKEGNINEAAKPNLLSIGNSLLPSRVALESADASVRLDAIARLKLDVKEDSRIWDKDFGRALLRRLIADDDASVASAAGMIVARRLKLVVVKGVVDGGDEDEEDNLVCDLVSLTKDALASLLRWTYIGKDDNSSWSPIPLLTVPTESKGKAKKSSIIANKDDVPCPLLACISICGSAARLILEQESLDIDCVVADLFYEVVLSLGGHIISGSYTESNVIDSSRVIRDTASNAAATELLHIFNNNDDSGIISTVPELITKQRKCLTIMNHLFGSPQYNMTPISSPLQSRFLWFALHSYSGVLSAPPPKRGHAPAFLQITLNLILKQMQIYTKESKKSASFQWEVHFLVELCKQYLVAVNDVYELEQCILGLTSNSSNVSFNEIVKPALLSSDQESFGASALLLACLHPNATTSGSSRLLMIVHQLSTRGEFMDLNTVKNCIIPALALLSHPDRAIRGNVMNILEQFQLTLKDQTLLDICSKATDKSTPLQSSLVMDGVSSLPTLLSQIMTSSNSLATQKFLLEGCIAVVFTKERNMSASGCQASAIILSSMEKAGENVFPLSKRWDLAGKELFEAFIKYDGTNILPSLSLLRNCVLSMQKGVVVNELQTIDDGMSIQISIGPSQTGQKMRSYSVGGLENFTTLEPYPDTMLQAVVKSLSSNAPPFNLSKHVIQLVVMRQSWANGIFPKLSVKSKSTVISALLSLRTRHSDELAGSAILNLPLRAAEFIEMLQAVDASKSEIDQSAVVFIADCIRGKLDILGTASDISMLSSKLFDQLLFLSSTKNTMAIDGDSGSRDYTRVSVLQTLYAIHSLYKSQLALTLDSGGGETPSKRKRNRSHLHVGSRKLLASEADLLVGLVGGNTSAFFPLDSGRGRALTLSLLTCLCEESPSAVATSLLPALLSLSEGDSSSGKKVNLKAFGDAFVAIIPAYCNHAPSANLSIFNLLQSLVGKIIYPSCEQVKSTYLLIDNLVFALKSLPNHGSSNDAIASLVACVMAMQSFHLQKPATMNDDTELELLDVEQDSQTRFDVRLMSNLKNGTKIAILLSLLHYADSLMAYICGSTAHTVDKPSENRMKVRISEVVVLAVNGASVDVGTQVAPYFQMSEAQQRSILYLIITLLQSIRDGLSTRMAKQVIRRSKGDDAALCLRLWNELLQTHTHALRAPAKLGMATMNATKKKFWSAASLATSDCLENLQNLLPIPHFLASISSALDSTSEVDTYIRKKSLGFLADRVTELSPNSPEASLFIEMVPDLLALIDVDTSSADDNSLAAIRRTIIMQQGCLVAIDCFVRYLYPITDNGKLAANAAAAFLPALASITSLLENTASSWKVAIDECSDGTSGVADAQCQLLSSCLLCISTIITNLKARCLPHLTTIINPLVASLILVNGLFDGVQESGTTVTELLQLSIVKTLTAIAISLPQFLPPFLPLLFSNDALLSNSLTHGTSIRDATLEVKSALASKVQIRQLTPALSQALSNTLNSDGGDWQEACNNLSLLTMVVEQSQRTEISPVIGKIFNGLVMAYGYKGDDSGSRSQLLMYANKCLISLVMKLSEAQLSPLYARLREWKGDIVDGESSVGESLTIRRHAFWSLSAELSKSLRSIFLPCLTSVLPDVIDELEHAVSLLCQGSTKKVDGAKRRRVDVFEDSIDDVVNKVKPLQPLLLCLESALKSDAHEGGNWTRGDDNQRYNMILGQLGKLLLSQVPKEMSLLTDLTLAEKTSTTAYQQLVQGVGTMEYGNIVGCLTALATAAGNEQLWKPLNFAVLDACGHKRSEVRKAGITCLLSIIETIGEEYMVLLPECLPVLSEMLEDEDEIAGMAKECVRQGEELLGESLENCLR